MIKEKELKIIELYTNPDKNVMELCAEMKISGKRLQNILKQHNIPNRGKSKFWTNEEFQWLKENYPSQGAEFCTAYLNRTPDQIYDKVKREKIQRDNKFIRTTNPKINLLVSWEIFDKSKDRDLILFKCTGCNCESQKMVREIKTTLKLDCDGIFCSLKCLNNYQGRDIPSKKELKILLNKGYTQEQMSEVYNKPVSTISSWINKRNLKNQSLNGGGYSFPCEHIKKELKKRNISFKSEVMPLKNRKYRADILFDEYKVIVEINGKEHYTLDGCLENNYQERHNLLLQNGWRVFEIPVRTAMKDDFLDTLLLQIYDTSFNPDDVYCCKKV